EVLALQRCHHASRLPADRVTSRSLSSHYPKGQRPSQLDHCREQKAHKRCHHTAHDGPTWSDNRPTDARRTGLPTGASQGELADLRLEISSKVSEAEVPVCGA